MYIFFLNIYYYKIKKKEKISIIIYTFIRLNSFFYNGYLFYFCD